MNRRKSFVLYFAISLMALTAAWGQSSATDTLVRKARALEGGGHPDLAAQTWQQVLVADPKQQEALAALASFAKQSGKMDESQKYLDRLRAINPAHPALKQVRSMPVLVQQQARLKEAARLAANQQFDQAMQIYVQIFGDEPPPGGLAIAYYETQASVPGGWERATVGLQKLMETYPDNDDYRIALGRLWTYRPSTRPAGMHLLESVRGADATSNKARQAWRQALVWEEGNPQVIPSLRAYLAKYRDPELQKTLDSLVAQNPQQQRQNGLAHTPTENLGFASLKANNVKQAEEQFEKALKENPKSVGALAGMGFVRMKQEDFAAAADLFEVAQEASPKDKDILDALDTAKFWKDMKGAADAFNADRLPDAAQLYREALTMRPNNPEATLGLGGTLMKMKDAESAAPLFEKLTQQQPQNDEAWYQLLNARYRANGADSVLAVERQLPASVRIGLSKNINFLALLSQANADAAHGLESKRYLQEAVELANTKGLVLPVPLQLQFGGLYLRNGYAVEGASVFQHVVDSDPQNVDAWAGLLGALLETHQESRAARAIERMPATVHDTAITRPDMLRSLAAVASSVGQLASAEKLLEKAVELDTADDEAANVTTKLQLAHIWLAQGRPQQAESVLRIMVNSYPDNPDAWKALVSALHQEGKDEAALGEDNLVPQAARTKLDDDPDYMSLLASSQNAMEQYNVALRLARRAEALMKQQNRPVPPNLNIQVGWLLLNTKGDERELYTLLTNLSKRTDLSDSEQRSVSELWSTWSLRRANAAIAAGDVARGASILEATVRLLPNDTVVKGAYAGSLLTAGDVEKAFAFYKTWGLRGGTVNDYVGAIGAAMGSGDNRLARTWTTAALSRWPNNAELLGTAGKLYSASGDYKTARTYLRSALNGLPTSAESAQSRVTPPPLPAEARTPAQTIGDLLLGPSALNGQPQPDNPASAAPSLSPSVTRRPDPLQPDGYRPSIPTLAAPPVHALPNVSKPNLTTSVPEENGRLILVSQNVLAPALPSVGVFPGEVAEQSQSQELAGDGQPIRRTLAILPGVSGVDPAPDSGVDTVTSASSLRDDIQSNLDAIDARNSPFFGTGGTIQTRSGDTGFEHMILEQADMEASTVVDNMLRVAVIGHPTYVDAGTPDGQSNKRFGLLPEGATFQSQSAGGVGGEVQASTATFGLEAGMTPQNFLVPNFIGGLRFRPGNGPITLLIQRQTIQDSMLSFAGARDPVTNRVWGGVLANSFSLLGNWGGAKTGFYTSFGYQSITGKDVASNDRLDGNVGVYWRIKEVKGGTITAGFNLSGMHYDKNLRYFTLGQGGYFSPQQYFLANVPFEWKGVYNQRIQYSVRGSFGFQHFQEDASPYFPTLPLVQGTNGPYYPQMASTGPNYSLLISTAIQLTPGWFIGASLDANNTRNYNLVGAGIFLRYSTKPRSQDPEQSATSIPDWRGNQPFRLQ